MSRPALISYITLYIDSLASYNEKLLSTEAFEVIDFWWSSTIWRVSKDTEVVLAQFYWIQGGQYDEQFFPCPQMEVVCLNFIKYLRKDIDFPTLLQICF